MKYPSASDILSELETVRQTGEVVWWKDLISVPFDKLTEPTGKLQILYKGKPLYALVKSEEVVIGSSNSGTFDYNASVKLEDKYSYKLVDIVGEIVQSLILAYKALAEDQKDVDPVKL